MNKRKKLTKKLSPLYPISASGRNGQHFAEGIFKRIFFNEYFRMLITILLNLIPKGPINNIPALF